MECMLEVTSKKHINTGIWAKSISGVNLSMMGGYALEGDWLTVEPVNAPVFASASTDRRDLYKVATFSSNPVVISVSFAMPSEEGSWHPVALAAKKKDMNVLDQVTFLIRERDYDHIQNIYASPHGIVTLACKGSEVVDMFGRLTYNYPVPQLDGKHTTNPNYKAAARMVADGLMKDNSGGATTMVPPAPKVADLPEINGKGNKPIELYGRNVIRADGHIITLPSSCKFMYRLEPSGVWVIAMKDKLVLADCLADFNTSDPDLIWFLEDQAARMENAAMTNRIIALSKKKGE